MHPIAQTPTPHTLPALLAGSPWLRQLVAEAAQQRHCLACVQTCLPEAAQAHCTAARIVEDTLVLFVDQAAWATRLRYQAASLCKAVSTDTRAVRRLRVRIFAAYTQPEPRKPGPAAGARLTPQQIDQWRAAVGLPARLSGNKPGRS